jgi:hypothetical protein
LTVKVKLTQVHSRRSGESARALFGLPGSDGIRQSCPAGASWRNQLKPLTGLVYSIVAVFGMGSEPLRTDLTWKSEPLPVLYIASILITVLLFELLPYIEEFVRGLRANRGRLVPPKARDAQSGQTTVR